MKKRILWGVVEVPDFFCIYTKCVGSWEQTLPFLIFFNRANIKDKINKKVKQPYGKMVPYHKI